MRRMIEVSGERRNAIAHHQEAAAHRPAPGDPGPFVVLAADPPWSFGDSLPGASRGASKNYATMSVEDIRSFPIPTMADDAILFLWRVSSMVEEAYSVCRAWGFVPKSELVWIKTGRGTVHEIVAKSYGRFVDEGEPAPKEKLHFGMGRYVRASHETCLIAVRGSFASKVVSHAERSVFFAPVQAHSQKPDEFYAVVERLAQGPRAELFARKTRPGWVQQGLELGKLVAASP